MQFRSNQIYKIYKIDLLKYCHWDAVQNFVSPLGTPCFHFYIGKTCKQLTIHTLNGPEKLKVFEHSQIHTLLPSV